MDGSIGGFTHDSPAVQSYLTILQGTISRMATNSASCKSWCITIVSALLVVAIDKHPEAVRVMVVPVILFGILDAYYLGLERLFRIRYDEFIGTLNLGLVSPDHLFLVRPVLGGDGVLGSTIQAITSWSVWPFYLLLVATVVIAKHLTM